MPTCPLNCNLYYLRESSTKKDQIICESKWHCWHTKHSGPRLTAIVCATIGPTTVHCQRCPAMRAQQQLPCRSYTKQCTVVGAENHESAEEAALAVEPPRATKSHLAVFLAANSLKRSIHSLQFELLLYSFGRGHKKTWSWAGEVENMCK